MSDLASRGASGDKDRKGALIFGTDDGDAESADGVDKRSHRTLFEPVIAGEKMSARSKGE